MRILFAAVFNPESTNTAQAEALERLGANVLRYKYRDVAEDIGVEGRNKQLINLCKEEKPDLVLFSKCNGITAKEVVECNKYSKTCLWYMDPVPHGHWDKEMFDKIKECTFTCVCKERALKEGRKYTDKIFMVLEGFDQLRDRPFPNITQDVDVSFIGSSDSYRKDMVDSVGGIIFEGKYGNNHAILVNRTRINLNFCRNGCVSDRVFKILAAKGFLLTDDWEGRSEYFDNYKDLVIFEDKMELQKKVDYYLTHPDEMDEIRAHGYRTVQKFTRDAWAKRIIDLYAECK